MPQTQARLRETRVETPLQRDDGEEHVLADAGAGAGVNAGYLRYRTLVTRTPLYGDLVEITQESGEHVRSATTYALPGLVFLRSPLEQARTVHWPRAVRWKRPPMHFARSVKGHSGTPNPKLSQSLSYSTDVCGRLYSSPILLRPPIVASSPSASQYVVLCDSCSRGTQSTSTSTSFTSALPSLLRPRRNLKTTLPGVPAGV